MAVITMQKFGKMGRFANQIFQYAFLKQYAEDYGCSLQLPPWVGNTLFGRADPPITESLPTFTEHAPHNWFFQQQQPRGAELVGHDFNGYAQYHTSHWNTPERKAAFRDQFRPTDEVRGRVSGAVGKLKQKGKTVVGVHLRRGDYGQLYFYITPVQWYLRLLRKLWPTLDKPVLFVATETPSLVEEFAEFQPETAGSLGAMLAGELSEYNYLDADRRTREPWQLDFYPDFYLLSQCDYLLIPNSTFSFAAAMLNPHLIECWRSNLVTERFHKVDVWDDWPILRDTVDDYPAEGTFLDANPPYWDKRTRAMITVQQHH